MRGRGLPVVQPAGLGRGATQGPQGPRLDVFCIVCPGGDSVIMLCGDDLDLIKNMADSTSLKEN